MNFLYCIYLFGWSRNSLTKKTKEEQRGFPGEPQGEPVGASHRRVGARRLEIDSDGVVVWSGGDGVEVWSRGDGGFSLFLSFRSSLSLSPILFSDYMWVLVCFEFLLWVSQISVDWISKSAAGTEDRRRQRGGLEIGGDGGFSLSLIPILSLSLWFSLSDWMWVLVLLWIFCRFNPNRFASLFFFFNFCFVFFFFVLILLLGFQFLMEFVFHRELEFFLLGCLICKVSNNSK